MIEDKEYRKILLTLSTICGLTVLALVLISVAMYVGQGFSPMTMVLFVFTGFAVVGSIIIMVGSTLVCVTEE